MSVALAQGQSLWEPGAPLSFIYFPTTSILSLVVTHADGRSVEALTVGPDGFAGNVDLADPNQAAMSVTVLLGGEAVRTPLDALRLHLSDPHVRLALDRFRSQAVEQIARNAACIAFHPILRRLSRWLLTVHDYGSQDELHLTHEQIAAKLAVQRPTVTLALATLESEGLVADSRRRVAILNRNGLRAVACPCYRTPKSGSV